MGRSVNSFSSSVGHAEETLSDDRVTLPEKDLWVAVLMSEPSWMPVKVLLN